MKTYGTFAICEKLDDLDKYIKSQFEVGYFKLDGIPPYVSIKLKKLFPGIRSTSTNPFYFKGTIEEAEDLRWFFKRYPVKFSKESEKELNERANRYIEFVDDTYSLLEENYKPKQAKLKNGKKGYDFQLVSAELFWKVKRLLVADEVGLGKTVTAIIGLTNPDTLPALVCVQSHLQDQWEERINEFCDLKVCKIKGGKPYSLEVADVYIIKYTTITKWLDVLIKMPFKTFITDEVQECRRLESQKSESCAKMAQMTEYSLALSGTPIFNYGDEVWNIYQIIKPDIFPDRDTFAREWCASYTQKLKDPQAMGTYLRDTFSYIRRTKQDVMNEIPPLNKITQTVGYNESDIKQMEKDAKSLALKITEGSFIERGQAAQELSVMVRKATGIAKARDVANFVKILLENGEPVLLAGYHRAVYDIWNKELAQYNPLMYTGSESSKKKQENKDKFVNGESNLMFISLKSGVGLDGLQNRCAYVVFGELDWTPEVHSQVIGRLYRKGQTRQVTAIFLICNSGSDPMVVDILGLKKNQIDGINDPFGKHRVATRDESIIKKYAKNILNKKG